MPIQILPPRLANQIAAGEVVERPASVVKELVENSLDAGATSVEIDIEKGGHKRIIIRDDGSGIPEPELALALSRHATSKIQSLDDLEAIMSLGFRGEALASVSSVARLTLSSKPKHQQQAWQAHCEGQDMAVKVNPVAHPDGSSVEVCDLFFNTPARRKFLKSEKTEFAHIDEVVRRIALSRFDIAFVLKHNGKTLRRYPAVREGQLPTKRLEAICGKDFAEGSQQLDSEYQQYQLKGWIMPSHVDNASNDFQYFYVNGRVMRDKLIHHALRQALEEYAEQGMGLSYLLYLTLPADQVDVNVHPAKHEVRFHQARLVHDFIYRALVDGLTHLVSESGGQTAHVMPAVEPSHDYIQPLRSLPSQGVAETSRTTFTSNAGKGGGSLANANTTAGAFGAKRAQIDSAQIQAESYRRYQQLMTPSSADSMSQPQLIPTWLRVSPSQLVVAQGDKFYSINLLELHLWALKARYVAQLPVSQPLLMPVSIQADAELLKRAQALQGPLLASAIEISWTQNRIILKKVPAELRHFPWADCLFELFAGEEVDEAAVREHMLSVIAHRESPLADERVTQLLSELTLDIETWEKQVLTIGKCIPLADWISNYE